MMDLGVTQGIYETIPFLWACWEGESGCSTRTAKLWGPGEAHFVAVWEQLL